MKTIRIDHPHNEASALLGVQNIDLLDRRGWDVAFWAASDEKAATEAIAVVGHRADSGEWEVEPLVVRADEKRATEDCETVSRAGSWVYVFGSQFGSKEGPLEPKRHFVMRFNEALIGIGKKRLRTDAEIARRPFAIHRLVNDALRRFEVKVLPPGSELYASCVKEALEKGERKKKRWCDLLREDDSPINIEGATFLPGGHLLLGLRYPVSQDGHPLVVEVEGIDRFFERGREPNAVAVRVLESVGKRSSPAGIRELDYLGGTVHAITGNLDSEASVSAIVEDHPEGARARSEHWAFPLVLGTRGAQAMTGKRLRRFEDSASVEGMALEGERVWYVHDDEQIVLEVGSLDHRGT